MHNKCDQKALSSFCGGVRARSFEIRPIHSSVLRNDGGVLQFFYSEDKKALQKRVHGSEITANNDHEKNLPLRREYLLEHMEKHVSSYAKLLVDKIVFSQHSEKRLEELQRMIIIACLQYDFHLHASRSEFLKHHIKNLASNRSHFYRSEK